MKGILKPSGGKAYVEQPKHVYALLNITAHSGQCEAKAQSILKNPEPQQNKNRYQCIQFHIRFGRRAMACTVQKAGDRKKFPGGPFPFGRSSRGRLVFCVCPPPFPRFPAFLRVFWWLFPRFPGRVFSSSRPLFRISCQKNTPFKRT